MNNPLLARLQHHVSGAIARGEAVAIVEQPAQMKITTNNQPRALVMGCDVPAAIMRSEFDYVPEDDYFSERFFCYRDSWYDLQEFSRVQLRGARGFNPMCHTAEPDSPLASWDAIATDSFFSGVVIRLVDDGDAVIVGRVYS